MARSTSPRFQISYVNPATRDEPADVPADIKLLVDAFENSTPMWAAGTLAARPAAGKSGRFYWATDQAFLSYDNGSQWTTVGPQPTMLVPTGAVLPFGGAAAPAGYLLTDGASYLVADYTALHGVIGYAFGGSGPNFNVPNAKGKVLASRDAAQTEFDTLAESGGAKVHQLTIAQLPSHNHGANGGGTTGEGSPHSHASPGTAFLHAADGSGNLYKSDNHAPGAGVFQQWWGWPVTMSENSHTHGLAPQGSDNAHNNLQPYLVVNHIIKT